MQTESDYLNGRTNGAQRSLWIYLTVFSVSNALLQRVVYGNISDKAFRIACEFETLPESEKRAVLEILQMRTEEST